MSHSCRRSRSSSLHEHPLNANLMYEGRVEKLARNIEREERYPPLVARPHPERPGSGSCSTGTSASRRCDASATRTRSSSRGLATGTARFPKAARKATRRSTLHHELTAEAPVPPGGRACCVRSFCRYLLRGPDSVARKRGPGRTTMTRPTRLHRWMRDAQHRQRTTTGCWRTSADSRRRSAQCSMRRPARPRIGCTGTAPALLPSTSRRRFDTSHERSPR